MKVGVIYPQTELRGDPRAVHEIGSAVERLGFDHILAYDHVIGATHDREPKLNGPYDERHPFHDPLVMFAYLAGITSRIELVTGILILPQRQTVLVARQAADVDLLSGSRLRLGIGLGWNYVEYDVLGQNFHVRGKRMEEQVGLLRQLWSEPLVSFTGRFDAVDRAALNPKPRGTIPLWFGGFSDVAMQRAARLGDGFIFVDGAMDAFDGAKRMQAYLDGLTRPAGSFGFHCNMLQAKSPPAVVETVQRWQDAGGTHASVSTMGQGFSECAQHVGYIEAVAQALEKAGLC